MKNGTMHKTHNNTQAGFTLVEMAVGLIIIGFLVVMAAAAFSGSLRFAARQKTFNDMERIADAISVYAQKHMRVPCPAAPGGAVGAEPFGAEPGSTANGAVFGTCATTGNNLEGIIPFATLGLPQNMARDHFGNFYTYRVSPTSAQRPADTATGAGASVHAWCMTEPYWYDVDAADYVNMAKAAFCCGTNIFNDIQIQDASSTTYPDLQRPGTNYITRATGAAARPTIAVLGAAPPPIFPAYILVSHGENGDGAFTSTGARAAANTAAEIENSDSDTTFFAPDRLSPLPTPAAGVALFSNSLDDIVFWETPAQVLGRIGRMSCARP